jgi:outer membrane murein-binding lipoprotein Lpp
MIFLNFILSPIGRWLLVLVLAAGLGASAYVKGRMDCAALTQEAALKTQVETLQSQIDSINALLENARAREAAAQEEAAKLNDKVTTYEEQLSNIPTPKSCGLTRNDIDRLRNIATGAAR